MKITKGMLIFTLVFLMFSDALNLRRGKSILSRIIVIQSLLFSIIIAANNLCPYTVNKSVELYGGLLTVTESTQVFFIFTCYVTVIVLVYISFYFRGDDVKNSSDMFFTALFPALHRYVRIIKFNMHRKWNALQWQDAVIPLIGAITLLYPIKMFLALFNMSVIVPVYFGVHFCVWTSMVLMCKDQELPTWFEFLCTFVTMVTFSSIMYFLIPCTLSLLSPYIGSKLIMWTREFPILDTGEFPIASQNIVNENGRNERGKITKWVCDMWTTNFGNIVYYTHTMNHASCPGDSTHTFLKNGSNNVFIKTKSRITSFVDWHSIGGYRQANPFLWISWEDHWMGETKVREKLYKGHNEEIIGAWREYHLSNGWVIRQNLQSPGNQ